MLMFILFDFVFFVEVFCVWCVYVFDVLFVVVCVGVWIVCVDFDWCVLFVLFVYVVLSGDECVCVVCFLWYEDVVCSVVMCVVLCDVFGVVFGIVL